MKGYARLNLAYSAVWMCRIKSTEADEVLRPVESGVYGGLNLALFVEPGG